MSVAEYYQLEHCIQLVKFLPLTRSRVATMLFYEVLNYDCSSNLYLLRVLFNAFTSVHADRIRVCLEAWLGGDFIGCCYCYRNNLTSLPILNY